MAIPGRTVVLVPQSPPEYADFVDRQIREYADQKARAGHWRPDEALARSREAMKDFLPGRSAPAGHRFYKGVDDAGRAVGWVWLGPPPKELHLTDARWLDQSTVEESLRRKGYARALLRAAEDLAAAEGAAALYTSTCSRGTAARRRCTIPRGTSCTTTAARRSGCTSHCDELEEAEPERPMSVSKSPTEEIVPFVASHPEDKESDQGDERSHDENQSRVGQPVAAAQVRVPLNRPFDCEP
ncbi:MAG: GNAT family N-acetyltransferase [Candidatus Thermoplasmatota archaeon]